MIRISVYYDGNEVKEFEQEGDREITVGRAAGCSLVLEEASISRLHVLLRAEGGRWLLERKANFGAVLLNGQEVENAVLEGGEEITIGKFSLRVNIEQSGASAGALVTSNSDFPEAEDENGRTRFMTAGANGLFRFEPGGANMAEFLLEKDLAVFGRGSNCDVVITEKKASRKQFEVRRQGLSFFLKDLNSSNGTSVNGKRASEVELVAGDIIEVGESKIQFSVENKDYFARQDQFMPVPTHLQDASPALSGGFGSFGEELAAGGGYTDLGASGIPDPHAPAEPVVSSTDLIGQFKRRWSKIPKKQRIRYLVILVAFAFIVSLLGEPDQEPAKKAKPAPGSTSARMYESLTPGRKKFVREKYADLIKAQEAKSFSKMQDLAREILTYVDDYKDTKSYESMAKKKLEEIEDERRRKVAEEKLAQLKKEVDALQEKGKIIFEKALADAKYRTELDSVIQEIYAKDPNNRLAREWKEKIKQKDDDDRVAAEKLRQREELKGKAEAALAAVEKTFQSEKYIDAIKEADKLPEVGYDDPEFISKVDKLKAAIREKLSSVIDPLLKEAATQSGEGGDLVKARELYKQVKKVDPSNKPAEDGMNAIYDKLHTRAKRLYAEAELANSVSDLAEAKEKYEKCLRVAPDEDVYKRRCRTKLSRFDALSGSGEGVGN